MAIRATFTGKLDAEGYPLEYLPGVPARSLTEDEYDALSTEQKHDVRHGGLYRMMDAKPKPKAEHAAQKAAPEQPAAEGS